MASAMAEAFPKLLADYIKINTSFRIGYPENNDKLHIMLFDTHTGEMLKKINAYRLLYSAKDKMLLDILPHENNGGRNEREIPTR